MANLLGFVDQNADTLQQMALLAYLKEPDVGEPLLQAITTYNVGRSVFKYVFKDDQIKRLSNETIVNIAAFSKSLLM